MFKSDGSEHHLTCEGHSVKAIGNSSEWVPHRAYWTLLSIYLLSLRFHLHFSLPTLMYLSSGIFQIVFSFLILGKLMHSCLSFSLMWALHCAIMSSSMAVGSVFSWDSCPLDCGWVHKEQFHVYSSQVLRMSFILISLLEVPTQGGGVNKVTLLYSSWESSSSMVSLLEARSFEKVYQTLDQSRKGCKQICLSHIVTVSHSHCQLWKDSTCNG